MHLVHLSDLPGGSQSISKTYSYYQFLFKVNLALVYRFRRAILQVVTEKTIDSKNYEKATITNSPYP